MMSRDDSQSQVSSRSFQQARGSAASLPNVSSCSLLADRSMLNASNVPSANNRTPKSGSGSSSSRTPRLGKSPGTGGNYDRYIPKRSSSASSLSASAANLSLKGSLDESVFQDADTSPRTAENRRNLSQALLGEKKDRILEFRAKPPPAPEGAANPFTSLYTHSIGKVGAANAKKIPRAIATTPFRILDAPDLQNDFYLTRIDWGSNNLLAVALTNSLYLWNGETAEIEELFSGDTTQDNQQYISGVSWLQGTNFLAVGNSANEVQIWDVEAKRKVRTMRGHTGRVSTLDWNSHILASGSRSGAIHYHDVRVAEFYFSSLKAHQQEVCGLKWSPDKRYLASGGNDNMVNIWPFPSKQGEKEYETPVQTFNLHQAAVKALAWCPWQPSVLASGGGTADRTIKLWNVNMGSLIVSKDTGSQVSGIVWSDDYRELVTGHGWSKNELILWKYPSFERIAELTGHTERILDLCMSADGSMVVSSGADESIRLWNMFPVDLEKKKKNEREKTKNTSVLSRQCIR